MKQLISQSTGQRHSNQTLRHVCDPKTTKARDTGSTPKTISYEVKLGGVASWSGTASTSNQPQSKGKDDGKRKQLTDSELQALINKAHAGDMSAVNALAGNFNIDDGVGTYIRTKDQIAADNKRVWDNTVRDFKILGGELSGWYNVKRLWTGKDPVTGEDANRWWAGVGLAFDVATYAFSVAKIGKGGKVAATAARTIDKVDDVSDATTAYRASKGLKAADTVDDVSDTSRAFKAADAVDDVGDSVKGLRGSKALSELPDNVQDAYKGYSSNNWQGTYRGQATGSKCLDFWES